MERRTFLQGGLAAGLTPLAGAALAQGGAPIRAGFLTVKSGPLASGGIAMEQGLAVYMKERGSTLPGRPVQVVTADTAGLPAQALAKTQEPVERERVHCLIGPLAAFEALAINDYIRSAEIPPSASPPART